MTNFYKQKKFFYFLYMKNKLFRIPLLTIGFIFIIMGLRYIFVDEPWMLDKVANEERLNMTFEKLFSKRYLADRFSSPTEIISLF